MKHPHTLHGLSFLNTRPTHQAENLTRLIQQRGGHVVHFPVINIRPVSFSLPDQMSFDCFIFLSSNAVHCFFQNFSSESLLPKFLIAIGPATQEALAKHNINNSICPAVYSSEGILALPLLQQTNHQKILIICGKNSKSLLPDTLKKRGAFVHRITCYERVIVKHHMLTEFKNLYNSNIQWIISTSLESLHALTSCFENPNHLHWLTQKKICVINNEMKTIAKNLGFQTVVQARNATDIEIVKILEKNALI